MNTNIWYPDSSPLWIETHGKQPHSIYLGSKFCILHAWQRKHRYPVEHMTVYSASQADSIQWENVVAFCQVLQTTT